MLSEPIVSNNVSKLNNFPDVSILLMNFVKQYCIFVNNIENTFNFQRRIHGTLNRQQIKQFREASYLKNLETHGESSRKLTYWESQ